MFKHKILLLLLAAVGLVSLQSDPDTRSEEELKKFYEEYQVKGSFILYDQKNNRYTLLQSGTEKYALHSCFNI